MSYLWNVLDFVPLVGVVKNAVEALGAFVRGDYRRGFSQSTQAVIGGVVDFASLGFGTLIVKSVTKTGAKILITHAAVAAGSLALGGRIGIYVATMPFTRTLQEFPTVMTPEMITLIVEQLAVGNIVRQGGPPNDNDENDLQQGVNLFTNHVINVGVVNLERRIIERFLADRGFTFDQLVEEGRITNNMGVFRAYHGSLPQHIVDNIERVMYLLEDAIDEMHDINFFDASQDLQHTVLEYMTMLFEGEDQDNNIDVAQQQENVTISEEAFTEVFVNERVRLGWLNQYQNIDIIPENIRTEITVRRRQIFNEAETAVRTILDNLIVNAEIWAVQINGAINNHNGNN